MKIEFLTMDDPLYVLPFFEEFFRSYSSEFDILQVSSCRTMGRLSRTQLLRKLLCLYRPLGFARLAGRVVAARVLGCLRRRRGAPHFSTLDQLCEAYRVPWQRIGNPNASEFVAETRARDPEVLVSVACPYILKQELLGLAGRGCINIHHAPLPRYKGMMPTFWQMYNGEKEVGVTVHCMSAKLDEGDALLQDALPIEPGETLDHLIRRSKRHGAHCMARVLRQIATGTQRPQALDYSQGSYFTFPTLAEIREFQRRGFRAI